MVMNFSPAETLGLFFAPGSNFSMMSPINIVYLHSHDTGRYTQPYGFAVSTPHIQRFAEEGVLFRQAFCAAPTCSPSRAALLTGQYPHQNGMVALAHKGGRLNEPGRHLANFLQNQGYVTALSGIQHVTGDKDPADLHALGYQRLLTKERWLDWATEFESQNQWYAQAAAEYIVAADSSKPFFLDCGFSLTHRMGAREQWHTTRNPPEGDPRYVRVPAPLPDTPETRRDFADFSAAASKLDDCIGTVLAALRSAGLEKNTLVIVTTDHGLASPLMKCNLTAHGTGVMLLMRGPGGFEGGKVVDALASHIDLFPTICEVAGLPAPDALEGVSLMPLVRGGDAVRDEVFAEVNWHAAPEPMRSVRTKRYNYIRRFSPHAGPVLPNCDDSVSKTFLREAGWDARAQVSEELYDLVFDPNEACNRADDPGCANVLGEMRDRLQAWMERTSDPLLSGGIDPRPGSTSLSMTDVSPQGKWPPAEVIRCQEPDSFRVKR